MTAELTEHQQRQAEYRRLHNERLKKINAGIKAVGEAFIKVIDETTALGPCKRSENYAHIVNAGKWRFDIENVERSGKDIGFRITSRFIGDGWIPGRKPWTQVKTADEVPDKCIEFLMKIIGLTQEHDAKNNREEAGRKARKQRELELLRLLKQEAVSVTFENEYSRDFTKTLRNGLTAEVDSNMDGLTLKVKCITNPKTLIFMIKALDEISNNIG